MWLRFLCACVLVLGFLNSVGVSQSVDLNDALEIVRTAFAAKLASKRPMEQECDLPIPQNPAFEALIGPYLNRQAAIPNGVTRFPIQRCRYQEGGFTAEVIMMNPDADQIARWVVTACRGSRRVAAGVLRFEQCVISAAREVWLQANAQYPVSGLVVEDVKCDVPKYAQWGFRHGVTVRLEGMPTSDNESHPEGVCQLPAKEVPRVCTDARIDDPALRESLLTARVVETAADARARLSNLDRTRVFHGNDGRCPRPNGAQPEWLDRSRDGYLAALGSDDYPMLTQWIDSDEELLKPGNRFACPKLDNKLLELDCR